jgi:hypothetical protein
MSQIDDKYATLTSLLGAPTAPELDASSGGRFRRYERGVIYWHPQTGAREVHGDILAKWQSLGAEAGVLGYPLTDEEGTRHGARYNHFVNGSLYWRAGEGTFWIPPQIFEKWATMDWEFGIGFPLSDPIDTIGGEIRQRFEKAVMIWTPQNGISVVHQPAPLNKVIRVFLVGWSDIAPPPGYTQEFFSRYFFGVGQPITNPDGGIIPASVYDYFSAVSDGFMQVSGVVMPWVTNPIQSSTIVTSAPDTQPWPRPGSVGTLGATVAQTLRTLGIRTMRDLEVNGASPDALIFIGLGVVGGGGATRTMAGNYSVKSELQRAGRMDLWDSAWDEFPDLRVTMTSCTYQDPAPRANPDTTYPTPPPGSLRWVRSSALHHELVHAQLKFDRDIYGGSWSFNTWHEVMSDTVWTDFPIPMSSYLRERNGFITIRDMLRQTHLRITLDPLETHSSAIRFQNGPMHAPETIVLENRRRLDYRQNPPPQLPNVIFAYSVDPKSRRVQSNGIRLTARAIKRIFEEWGDVWGTAPGVDLVGQGEHLANTLTPAGEHWWDFRNIQVASNNQIQLDAVYKPQDLLTQYQTASWINSRGETLMPNVAHGQRGHVLMVNRSIPIAGRRRYEHVLNIHPDWNPNGSVQGAYQVPIPPAGARLYVTAALSEGAVGSDGIKVVIRVNDEVRAEHVLTSNRNMRTFAVDLLDVRNSDARISIGIEAGTTAIRDWAHILEAVVVPTASVLIDLLSATSTATWQTNSGNIPFNGAIGPQGHAREAVNVPLQNGVVYGRRLLYTHPAWRNDGFIEGYFPVTLPNQASVFRAELGFPEGRTVTDNGASFSVRFIDAGGVSTDILMNGQLARLPMMGEKGVERNSVLAPAVQLPSSLQGVTGQLVLRVDANGSATEDQIYWTMARITSD